MLYLLVLAACLVGTLPLELFVGARVYRRWRRLGLTLLPVLVVFIVWDVLAIRAGWWSYRHLTGVRLGDLPIEELAFFVVIPICVLLTYEAVLALRPEWAERVVDSNRHSGSEP